MSRKDRDLIDRKIKEEKRFFDTDLLETVESVFDKATISTVLHLMRTKCIKSLKGVISSGKEARVYWGIDYEGRDVAVKIYYTLTSEFKKSMWKYLAGDPRYDEYKGMNWKKLIYMWASKEYRNLVRMHRSGVRVPKPLCIKNNVLVMEFIGENGVRAPLLKEAYEEELLSIEDLENIYRDIMDQIKVMIREAKLVHADLSEYNIMIHMNKPYIIDVSQALPINHPNAQEFLRADITNITRFFEKTGIQVIDPEEFIKELLSSD